MGHQPHHFTTAMTELLTAEASRLGETVDAFISRSVALRLLGQLERRRDPRREAHWLAFARAGLLDLPSSPDVQHSVITNPARLRTLADTGLLDTAANSYFDGVVAIAAEALGAPAAAITL
ncbi:MAG: GAF domain-containing protein, partial [Mycobacterium sp.]